ncbi:MAG: ankyrin repeat domain-containing protein [Planctomycetes bacterium]|nr:ankyrin repeat domain-containing protein [Planctomycetota bacterium]MBI3834794.1 ankyrin repeat domain-containing protein [Planctomycetota bacterium]
MRKAIYGVGLFLTAISLSNPCASGHETDQYSVPVGREFADLRFYFSEQFHDAMQRALDSVNDRIARSLLEGRPTSETERLMSQDEIVTAVINEFPPVAYHVEALEAQLHAADLQARFPGMIVAYKPFFWIYHHFMLLLDPTKFVRLNRSSTIMIDGVYLGTDKIVHFLHMGHIYYTTWRDAVRSGKTDAEAEQAAIELGTGAGPLSEASLLGMLSTGVWSNGDLAADYCGLKFFRNLTETIRIRGEDRPPMLIHDGPYWRFNQHVRRNTDFISVFVSDHWDEVLNPNEYIIGMGTWVCESIKSRCEAVRDWFSDRGGRRRSREDFIAIANQLSTYYGENYGFSGDPEKMVGMANCCFEASSGEADEARRSASTAAVSNANDVFHRTALWHAANDGDVERVRDFLQQGMNANAADIDGETPLHRAVQRGAPAIIDLLLTHDADPLKADHYGVTPLHWAARASLGETFNHLVSLSGKVNVHDIFGRTPLHDAVEYGATSNIHSLLRAGADPNAADVSGNTPLHVAARIGVPARVVLLMDHGSDVLTVNALGRKPADEAALHHHQSTSEILDEAGLIRKASFPMKAGNHG